LKIRYGAHIYSVDNLSSCAEEWAAYLLALSKAMEEGRFFSGLDFKSLGDLNQYQNPSGLLLSTSGTRGERTCVLHSWERITERLQAYEVMDYSTASFYSMTHAAGIELFLGYYTKNGELGVYAPELAPRRALELLSSQQAQALCLTPSTFLRFIGYPRLAEWIQTNVKIISFGGETVSDSLKISLQNNYSHIKCLSGFGTTETWSIKTKTGKDLGWHIPSDEKVVINHEDSRLQVRTPYLFTHRLVGDKFEPIENQAWETGDEIEWQDGQFRIIRSLHLKYHGLKIYPHEWEQQLEKQFQLPWVQIVESQNELLGVLPKGQEDLIPLIKLECTSHQWPVVNWICEQEMRTSERGKKVMR
jgi:acyl-CoA synthetase (AMP-forming)/AMP-acid ligase II